MHVIATAGHVDHGKSTLVRALTGTDPDRLAEEHRRGLSIELGYCWTELPGVGEVAFVDVPGHERFVTTMLAGVGPVPAALLVVAADDPWMPQAAEHLAALDAIGVAHGVVAVTRSDLADPAAAVARARAEVDATSLREAPVVAVSAHTGAGLDELRRVLVAMLRSLPEPDPAADVRLWVDRRFTVKGAGTVVTGTLPAGTVREGDVLESGSVRVRVRGVEALGRRVDEVSGVARVALNLAGEADDLDRGSVLVTPEAWLATEVVDVRLSRAERLPPQRPLLHVGATAVSVHCRPLAADLVRLRLDRALPLRVGDRALLRDPGARTVWGLTVLDPSPPALRLRGAAAARAEELRRVVGPDLAGEVARRGLVRHDLLRRIGVPVTDDPAPGVLSASGWLVSAERAASAEREASTVVAAHEAATPLDPGVPLTVLAERLGLPSADLARAVVRPPLEVRAGRVSTGAVAGLPDTVLRAVDAVTADFVSDPFAAPTAERLREVGLDNRAAAAAAKAGLLLRPAPGVVLPPDADRRAARLLAGLPQPFTASQARVRLGTSRRVALPLLEHLDRTGLTRRLPGDLREVVGP